jgi:hypothetical protein
MPNSRSITSTPSGTPHPDGSPEWDKATGRSFVNWNARKNAWNVRSLGARSRTVKMPGSRIEPTRSEDSRLPLSELPPRAGVTTWHVRHGRRIRGGLPSYRDDLSQRNVTNVAFVWTMMAWTFDGRPGVTRWTTTQTATSISWDRRLQLVRRTGHGDRPFADVFAATRAFALHGASRGWS